MPDILVLFLTSVDKVDFTMPMNSYILLTVSHWYLLLSNLARNTMVSLHWLPVNAYSCRQTDYVFVTKNQFH